MNMKGLKSIIFAAAALVALPMAVTSCSDWTEVEADDFYQDNGEAYYANLKDYFASPHKVTFGWFGSWSCGTKANQLVGLPDSVDFVSLWLTWGPLTQAQQADLKAFQARGSKAVLCWRAGNIGANLTPGYESNANPPLSAAKEYWGFVQTSDINPETGDNYTKEEAIASQIAAARKYADAIADTCEKYNVDGFDYDIEDDGTLNSSGDYAIVHNEFLRRLYERFEPAGRMLVIDIPGGGGWLGYYDRLEDEVVDKMVKYICWQTYELDHAGLDSFFDGVKSYKPDIFPQVLAKSIVTATFERAADKYLYPIQSTWQYYKGLPHAGQGAYHIEYDYPGNPDYPYVRKGIATQNPPVNQ